jgi:hypothetical protein
VTESDGKIRPLAITKSDRYRGDKREAAVRRKTGVPFQSRKKEESAFCFAAGRIKALLVLIRFRLTKKQNSRLYDGPIVVQKWAAAARERTKSCRGHSLTFSVKS